MIAIAHTFLHYGLFWWDSNCYKNRKRKSKLRQSYVQSIFHHGILNENFLLKINVGGKSERKNVVNYKINWIQNWLAPDNFQYKYKTHPFKIQNSYVKNDGE